MLLAISSLNWDCNPVSGEWDSGSNNESWTALNNVEQCGVCDLVSVWQASANQVV